MPLYWDFQKWSAMLSELYLKIIISETSTAHEEPQMKPSHTSKYAAPHENTSSEDNMYM